MKDKKGSYKTAIISALIGGTFFGIPYLALSMPVLPSLGIALVAFGAGNMLISDSDSNKNSRKEKNSQNLYEILNCAKKQNAKIYEVMHKIEDKDLVKNINEIHETASKIIDTITKNPKKIDKVQNFFNYYLPVTLKILLRYDEIENQKLESNESKEILKSTYDMTLKINKSFKMQLNNLYQTEIIDTDAEIKVFEKMLDSDGFSDINDFNLK